MKKKLFMLLALAVTTLAASAEDVPTYALTKGTSEHGTITFKVGETENATAAQEGQTVTVMIEPDEGYVVNKPFGQWYAAIVAAPRRADIDLLNAVEFTEAGENQWTFTMERANAEIGMTYKKLLTNPDITVEDIAAVTYTGKAQTPTVTVKDGTTTLVLGTDYTVGYSNNVNTGTATVTITGKGDNYAGTITKNFTINKGPGSIAFAESAYEKTYGDEDFTNALTIIKGDGIVSYASSDKKVASVDPKTGVVRALREGTATITATMGSGKNYHGASASFEVTVHEKVVEDEAGKGITLDADGYHFVINENEAIGEVIGSEYGKVPSLEYTRTLQTAGKTAVNVDNEQRFLFTLCVPFEPGFAAKFYTLSAVEGTVLKFEEVKKPKAYTPYLVATTKDVSVSTEVVIIDGDWPKSDSKRAAADNKNEFTNQIKNLDFDHVIYHGTPVDGYQLKGTLRGMSNADAAAEGAYIMQNSGKWGAVKAGNEKVYIPLFRAYIVAASQSAQELNNGFDGGTTAIRHIVTVDQDGTERWYDLNGRPVEKPATKGIYIHNGKKVVIK